MKGKDYMDGKKIFTRYRVESIAFYIIWILVTPVAMTFVKVLWLRIAIIAIMIVLLNPILRVILNCNFYPVLFKQLDAEKFKKAISSSDLFFPPISYKINASIYSGDYLAAVSICTKKLKEKCSLKNKCRYLSVLAEAYFELGDDEKLKAVCDKFSEVTEKSKNPKKMKSQFPLFRFYRHCLDRNFENCLAIYDDIKANSNPKSLTYKIDGLYGDFNCAVIYYKMGDYEKAKQYFAKVTKKGAKMNASTLAKEYLYAIESGDDSCLKKDEILPDDNYSI